MKRYNNNRRFTAMKRNLNNNNTTNISSNSKKRRFVSLSCLSSGQCLHTILIFILMIVVFIQIYNITYYQTFTTTTTSSTTTISTANSIMALNLFKFHNSNTSSNNNSNSNNYMEWFYPHQPSSLLLSKKTETLPLLSSSSTTTTKTTTTTTTNHNTYTADNDTSESISKFSTLVNESTSSSSSSSSSYTGERTTRPPRITKRQQYQYQQQQQLINENRSMNEQQQKGIPKVRVLMGIFSTDTMKDQTYRILHRKLIYSIYNDTRICTLYEYQQQLLLINKYNNDNNNNDIECELIYTFVIGGNPNESSELLDTSRPILVEPDTVSNHNYISTDIINNNNNKKRDITLLNIRENMNEGKSQTWLYYCTTLLKQDNNNSNNNNNYYYDIDYIMKMDSDTVLQLYDYFHFIQINYIPKRPYNSMMYIGALRDKAFWPKHTNPIEYNKFESYFGQIYDGVHLYIAGQLYIVAIDLAEYIVQEAIYGKCSYCEGHEDHDISSIAFHTPPKRPIKLIVVGRNHRFWDHPVKGGPRWKYIFERERNNTLY